MGQNRVETCMLFCQTTCCRPCAQACWGRRHPTSSGFLLARAAHHLSSLFTCLDTCSCPGVTTPPLACLHCCLAPNMLRRWEARCLLVRSLHLARGSPTWVSSVLQPNLPDARSHLVPASLVLASCERPSPLFSRW